MEPDGWACLGKNELRYIPSGSPFFQKLNKDFGGFDAECVAAKMYFFDFSWIETMRYGLISALVSSVSPFPCNENTLAVTVPVLSMYYSSGKPRDWKMLYV